MTSKDHAQELTTFINALSIEKELVASELDVLRSIYGDEAIWIWDPSTAPSANDLVTLRYEVDINLPSFEDIHVKVLVSLPPSYPTVSPPQLQLLSRYIGAFGVTPQLFGDVLKTFISSKSPVEFAPDSVAVFDGLQHVAEMCSAWFADRLDAEKAREIVREEGRNHHLVIYNDSSIAVAESSTTRGNHASPPGQDLPDGVELFEAEPITDRKSVFIGRACRITHPSQVPLILSYLMEDKRTARAAHPIINAWRCKVDNVMHQNNDDDGESAAGGRLAHLLQILELDGVLVIVTRFFGGIHLGPDRFKHINEAARSALEKGHFLDVEDKTRGNPRNRKQR